MPDSAGSLTACEAEIMDVIWRRDAITVQEIVDDLERPLAYTTVLTMVRILEEKGFVVRTEKRGRAFVYRPVVTRKTVRSTMSRNLVDLIFGGSTKSLVLSLVEDRSLSREELDELRGLIDDLERDQP
jgi:BlaI family transcriptional regulator, penicillinase repressor